MLRNSSASIGIHQPHRGVKRNVLPSGLQGNDADTYPAHADVTSCPLRYADKVPDKAYPSGQFLVLKHKVRHVRSP